MPSPSSSTMDAPWRKASGGGMPFSEAEARKAPQALRSRSERRVRCRPLSCRGLQIGIEMLRFRFEGLLVSTEALGFRFQEMSCLD